MDCASLNTTECILLAATRILAAIEKSADEPNWDPQTFAVTLIIGIIALFFAALTIVHGLVAAAPGKHCSSYALGPWAHYSKKRIDWSEMRIQATAYTPIVHLTAVYRYLRQVEDVKRQCANSLEAELFMSHKGDWAVRAECRKALGKRSRHLFPPSKSLGEYFPATWLALLTSVDMDNPGLWTLKPIRTDYIPSDLVAAPAYATVRDMVVLSAISAYPQKLTLLYQQNSVLSSVQGPDFNLELRQHPTIGFHGVYQTFDLKGLNARYSGDTEIPSQAAYKHILSRLVTFVSSLIHGRIALHAPPLNSLLLPKPRDSLDLVMNAYGHLPQLEELEYDQSGDFLCLYTQERAVRRRSIEWIHDSKRLRRSWKSSTCTDTGSTKCLDPNALYPCWCKHGGYSFIKVIGTNMHFGASDHESCWSLLMARCPSISPTIFPRRVVNMEAKLQGLLVLSRFWSLHGDVLEHSYLAGGFRGFPHEGYNRATGSLACVDDTTDRIPRSRPILQGNTFVPSGEAIEECRQYLEAIDEGQDFEMEDEILIFLETTKIDEYLESMCPDLLSCRRICLGLSASVCSYMIRTQSANDLLDRPLSLDPDGCSDAGECTIPWDFYSDTSRRRVTDLCYMLEKFIPWYRADPFEFYDKDIPKGRRFPGFGLGDPRNADGKTLTAEQYSCIADELEKVLKLWEVDGNGDFVYDKTEVQQYVDDLLIYRCILIAMSYTNAVDNSDFLEDPTYTKYIPLI